MSDIENLIGATIIEVTGMTVGSDVVCIVTDRGTLVLEHSQDCCEAVDVEDVTGDPNDLIGGVVSVAEERVGDAPEGLNRDTTYIESETWTFYEIRTSKGDVTLRWLGTSNGYYSESVSTSWKPVARF